MNFRENKALHIESQNARAGRELNPTLLVCTYREPGNVEGVYN